MYGTKGGIKNREKQKESKKNCKSGRLIFTLKNCEK